MHNFNVLEENCLSGKNIQVFSVVSFPRVVQLMHLCIFFSSQKVYSAAQNKLNREVIDKFRGGLLLVRRKEYRMVLIF